MKKQLLTIIAGMLLLVANASAQSDSLGVVAISPDYPQCPDTAFGNQPYLNIQVTIHNYNPNNAFTGIIYVCFKSDTIYPADSIILNAGATFTILANSNLTVSTQVPYFFSSANYKLGSNVIVVWPVAGPGTAPIKYNPFYTCVNFQLSSGINNVNDNKLSITPNPAQEYLEIITPPENSVKDVRIFDAAGRQVLWKTDVRNRRVSIQQLSKGIYVMQMRMQNDKVIYHRFVKQ